MNMDMAIGLTLGLLMGAAIMGVFMGTVAHQHYDRYKAMKATAFGLEQQLLDCLEGQTYPKYVMSTEGVNPVVTRNRPDLEGKFHEQVPDGTMVHDLTEVEDE